MQPASLSSLPIDLVAEIALRSDPIALLRCAAACKHLRRLIAGGAGLRRGELRLRNATNSFVPVLLCGFFYQPRPRSPLHPRPQLRFVTNAHDNAVDAAAGKLLSTVSHDGDGRRRFDPVAARGGFIVHRTDDSSGEVCNPMTGYVSRSINLPRKNNGTCYLLLTADDSVAVDEPFRLLAVRLYDTSAVYEGRIRLKLQELSL
uniref:F-box domain-containing protein n=1 Tax=Leersia perrieri TaxID=77586 RepID=A0A0D9WP43_9ORYZ